MSVAEIWIVVNDRPSLTMTPGDGAVLFAGSNATFSATGTAAVTGAPINPVTMVWYKDGVLWGGKTGSPITVNPGDMTVGYHQIRCVASDSAWGTVGTVNHSIYYGYANPTITSPAQGTAFAVGSPVTFTGTPGEFRSIVPEWWLDRGTNGAVRMGTGGRCSYPVPDGNHTISYVITDSVGNVGVATVGISMTDPSTGGDGDPPVMSFTPGEGAGVLQDCVATFTATGIEAVTGSPIDPATMVWYKDGVAWGKTGAVIIVSSTNWGVPGPHQIRVEGTDSLGRTGSVSHTIHYGYAVLAYLTPAAGTLYPIGSTVNLLNDTYYSRPPFPSGYSAEWWLDKGTAGAVLMGTGTSLSYPVPYGRHDITYVLTDTFNNTTSRLTSVVMDDPPVMSFTPGEGAGVLANCNATLTATGTAAVTGAAIDPATMVWYLDGAAWGKTGAPVTVNPADWNGGGWHQVMVTGADSLGRSTHVSHSLFYGAMSITALAGAHGSIAPSGMVAVIAESRTNFVITPDVYFHITNLVVDGLAVGMTNDYTFEHVTAMSTIEAYFAENLATNGTPEWWLAQYGWTNDFDAAATNDADHDGLMTWQEWIAGTNPTNQFSVLSVTNMFPSASGFVLHWPSVANRTYEVDRTTNLRLSGFDVIATNLPATPPMNVHTDELQGVDKAFYRIKVQ